MIIIFAKKIETKKNLKKKEESKTFLKKIKTKKNKKKKNPKSLLKKNNHRKKNQTSFEKKHAIFFPYGKIFPALK